MAWAAVEQALTVPKTGPLMPLAILTCAAAELPMVRNKVSGCVAFFLWTNMSS